MGRVRDPRPAFRRRGLASKGDRIAGSGFDSSKLGGDLFTLSAATVDGRNVVTIEATDRYRALVSDDSHEAGWRATSSASASP